MKLLSWFVLLEALRTTVNNPVLIKPVPPMMKPSWMWKELFPYANVPTTLMDAPSETVKRLLVPPAEPKPTWKLPMIFAEVPAPTTTPVLLLQEPPNSREPDWKSLAPLETINWPPLPLNLRSPAEVSVAALVGPD